MKTQLLYTGQEKTAQDILATKNIVVIADACTNGFCLFVAQKLITEISNARLIIIPQGEQNKTLEIVEYIWLQMQKIGVNKSWFAINIGGGMVCDIGGFACGTYMRGIPFTNIPTTLLAMNDASFGGKTGFNFGDIKNNIGLISHPAFAYINPIFLNTLSERHIANGAVESIKHALIHDTDLWKNMVDNMQLSKFTELINIQASINIKAHFVMQDEADNHIRQSLNFGHSIGHAIEACHTNQAPQILHGEAVLLGMLAELSISENILGTDKNIRQQLLKIHQSLYPNVRLGANPTNVLSKIYFDKKNTDFIQMTLLHAVAKPALQVQVSVAQILEALAQLPTIE